MASTFLIVGGLFSKGASFFSKSSLDFFKSSLDFLKRRRAFLAGRFFLLLTTALGLKMRVRD